jgi:hypothetical protein
MDKSILKAFLARCSRHTFACFVVELFSADPEEGGHEGFHPLVEAGEDIFYQPLVDSYGGSIHRVYLLHFPPLELFHPSHTLTMDDPVLMRRLAKVRNIYKGKIGYWGMVSPYLKKDEALRAVGFVTNFSGLEADVYQELLLPAYQRLKRYCGLKKPPVLVGSCDSFLDRVPDKTQRVFKNFIQNYSDGLAISITEEGASVNSFVSERNLAAAVFPDTKFPYEPVFVGLAIRQRAVLAKFESLINSDASEAILEEFIVAHYKDIFGTKYDRVEPQLWLRFPELDIAEQNRRLDVFLRNSVVNDWELFEVKRPISMTSTYRDAPVIAREVSNAIHQIRNYARILSQDRVKRHFAKEGIEYYEPSLNLVIGKTPQIPHDQWRWLRSSNEDRVKIITFDDLLSEMRCRFEDRYAVLVQAEHIGNASSKQ